MQVSTQLVSFVNQWAVNGKTGNIRKFRLEFAEGFVRTSVHLIFRDYGLDYSLPVTCEDVPEELRGICLDIEKGDELKDLLAGIDPDEAKSFELEASLHDDDALYMLEVGDNTCEAELLDGPLISTFPERNEEHGVSYDPGAKRFSFVVGKHTVVCNTLEDFTVWELKLIKHIFTKQDSDKPVDEEKEISYAQQPEKKKKPTKSSKSKKDLAKTQGKWKSADESQKKATEEKKKEPETSPEASADTPPAESPEPSPDAETEPETENEAVTTPAADTENKKEKTSEKTSSEKSNSNKESGNMSEGKKRKRRTPEEMIQDYKEEIDKRAKKAGLGPFDLVDRGETAGESPKELLKQAITCLEKAAEQQDDTPDESLSAESVQKAVQDGKLRITVSAEGIVVEDG